MGRTVKIIQRTLLAAALLAAGNAWADVDTFSITADQWAAPRSGAELVAMPSLRAAVQDCLAHPGSRLVIVHAGSDTANLWAGELADWLVALGISSDRIDRRVSGGQDENTLTLEVQY